MDHLREAMKRTKGLGPAAAMMQIMEETGEGPMGWEKWSGNVWTDLLIPAAVGAVILAGIYLLLGGHLGPTATHIINSLKGSK